MEYGSKSHRFFYCTAPFHGPLKSSCWSTDGATAYKNWKWQNEMKFSWSLIWIRNFVENCWTLCEGVSLFNGMVITDQPWHSSRIVAIHSGSAPVCAIHSCLCPWCPSRCLTFFFLVFHVLFFQGLYQTADLLLGRLFWPCVPKISISYHWCSPAVFGMVRSSP